MSASGMPAGARARVKALVQPERRDGGSAISPAAAEQAVRFHGAALAQPLASWITLRTRRFRPDVTGGT